MYTLLHIWQSISKRNWSWKTWMRFWYTYSLCIFFFSIGLKCITLLTLSNNGLFMHYSDNTMDACALEMTIIALVWTTTEIDGMKNDCCCRKVLYAVRRLLLSLLVVLSLITRIWLCCLCTLIYSQKKPYSYKSLYMCIALVCQLYPFSIFYFYLCYVCTGKIAIIQFW